MAHETFQAAVDHVLIHEGGYVDHVSDPGGATNMGITIGTLREWRGSPTTKDDVRALTRDEATKIYRANYWDKIRGDDLPAGLDYAVFDYAVNSGVSRAATALQKLAGVTQDGAIGPITLAAVAKLSIVPAINDYCNARLRFLRDLSTWSTFGKGWQRRVDDVREVALELAQTAAEPAGAPEPEPAPSHVTSDEDRLAALMTAYEGILKAMPPAGLAERVVVLEERVAALESGSQAIR